MIFILYKTVVLDYKNIMFSSVMNNNILDNNVYFT